MPSYRLPPGSLQLPRASETFLSVELWPMSQAQGYFRFVGEQVEGGTGMGLGVCMGYSWVFGCGVWHLWQRQAISWQSHATSLPPYSL